MNSIYYWQSRRRHVLPEIKKIPKESSMMNPVSIVSLVGLFLLAPFASAGEIIHDAEYAIIEAQNGKAWATDDKTIDEKLAEIRKKNGGKAPNIVYILLDDVGFGEIGMDEISVIRGYKTPNSCMCHS